MNRQAVSRAPSLPALLQPQKNSLRKPSVVSALLGVARVGVGESPLVTRKTVSGAGGGD